MDKTGKTSGSRLRNLGFRFMPTLITVLIVAGVFYFYLTVFVNRNETELLERKFRGLHQIAENLKQKIDRYQDKNVGNFLITLDSLNKKKQTKTYEKDTAKANTALRQEYGLSEIRRNDKAGKKDSVQASLSQRVSFLRSEKRIVFSKENKPMAAGALINEFLEPLLRKDVFSNYMLAFNNDIIYDELNHSYDSLHEFISKSVENDTIRSITYNPTGQVGTVIVGGKKYRLFTQRFIVDRDESFSIGGYLPEDEYMLESNYVPTYLIVWLIIGVVLAVIMVPLLRIFLLHASEQLTTLAASSAFAAAHVLASVIMLTLMGVFLYFVIFRSADNDRLKILADSIEKNLNEEIIAGINTIKKANQWLMDSTHSDDVLLEKKPGYNLSGKFVDSSSIGTLLNRDSTPDFSHIIWVDSTGQQLLRWTTDLTVPRKISIKERDYFQAIINDNVFYTDKDEPYFFGAISSWVSSKTLAALSIPYKYSGKNPMPEADSLLPKLSAVYMTGQFQSLYTPVVPYGYGYCVIDETGKVLFHKDEQKNLTENFIRECSDPADLRSRVSTRIEGFFDGTYLGSFQSFFYRPIGGTRYSIITYKDKQITWEEDLDIISVCSIFLLMNLVLILLVFAHIRFTSYTNSRIKEKHFSFSWLRPTFALKQDYIFISMFYALSMLLQTGYLLLGSGADNAGILESTFAYSYILLLLTHHRFSTTLDPDRATGKGARPRKIQKRFLLLLLPYLVLTVLFMIICLQDCLWPLIVQAGHFLLYAYLTQRIISVVTPANRFINKRLGSKSSNMAYYWKVISVNMTFRRIFTSFAFGLIISTSVIPVLIFYSLCYHEERNQSVAYTQLNFARKLPKDTTLILRYANKNVPNTIHNPYYYEVFANSVSLLPATETADDKPNRFSQFYHYVKPSFSRYSRQLELLGGADGVDGEFSLSQNTQSDKTILLYRFGKRINEAGKNSNVIAGASRKTTYDWQILSDTTPSILATGATQSSALLVIVVALLLLFGFYLLISQLIRKIFFEGSADSSYLKEETRNVADFLKLRGNLFVHAMPGADKPDEKRWKPIGSPSGSGTELPALINYADPSTNSFIIAGINPLRNDHATIEKHIGVIESTIADKRRVVVISNINQERFSSAMKLLHQDLSVRWEEVRKSFYHVNAGSSYLHASNPNRKLDAAAFTKRVISHIQKVYHESDHQPALTGDEQKMISTSCSHLVEKLGQECSYTAYLPSCFQPLFNFSRDMAVSIFDDIDLVPRGSLRKVVENRLKFVFENACLQLKGMATNFYEELWSCLDLDEQRTLYDIAIDDLVNPANRKTAARLAELGIIKPERYVSCYQLFNISFRSFVFDHVAKNEITAFKEEIKQQGRTGNILLPLGITIVACIVFIFTTQKDAFLDLITYLGAAAAGITGILKVISIIPNSKSGAS